MPEKICPCRRASVCFKFVCMMDYCKPQACVFFDLMKKQEQDSEVTIKGDTFSVGLSWNQRRDGVDYRIHYLLLKRRYSTGKYYIQ